MAGYHAQTSGPTVGGIVLLIKWKLIHLKSQKSLIQPKGTTIVPKHQIWEHSFVKKGRSTHLPAPSHLVPHEHHGPSVEVLQTIEVGVFSVALQLGAGFGGFLLQLLRLVFFEVFEFQRELVV